MNILGFSWIVELDMSLLHKENYLNFVLSTALVAVYTLSASTSMDSFMTIETLDEGQLEVTIILPSDMDPVFSLVHSMIKSKICYPWVMTANSQLQ